MDAAGKRVLEKGYEEVMVDEVTGNAMLDRISALFP